MSERQRHDEPGSRAPGGQRPRLTARRRLTQAGTRNTTSGSTNAQAPPSSSTRPNTASPITNFVRNGDNWSYTYEYEGFRIFMSGTGDIPAAITRTTPHGLERITFNRNGVTSRSIIGPPGAYFNLNDTRGMNITGSVCNMVGCSVGSITMGGQEGITMVGGSGGSITIEGQGGMTRVDVNGFFTSIFGSSNDDESTTSASESSGSEDEEQSPSDSSASEDEEESPDDASSSASEENSSDSDFSD